MDAATIRRINLIEVLREDAEADGTAIAPLPEDASSKWTDDQIKAHFGNTGSVRGQPPAGPVQPHEEDIQEFNKWFPGLTRSGTNTSQPRLRVLCLPSAGNAEDMYTSEGTGARRASNPLLDWCRANSAELLAVQPPGRGMRLKEPPATSAQDMAQQILKVLSPRLGGVPWTPWVVISHSMGCWVAYELLKMCRASGLPLPSAWFLSAMPAPDIPASQRPWTAQHLLDEQQFKVECLGWDVNEAVFTPGMWPVYQPLLRSDFHIFDSYVFNAEDSSPFDGVSIVSWWGKYDKRISHLKVQEWQRFTTASFSCNCISGNHLWPLDKECKQIWLQQIVSHLDSIVFKDVRQSLQGRESNVV